MSSTLQTTIDETVAKLQFNRYLVLGSEYDLTF